MWYHSSLYFYHRYHIGHADFVPAQLRTEIVLSKWWCGVEVRTAASILNFCPPCAKWSLSGCVRWVTWSMQCVMSETKWLMVFFFFFFGGDSLFCSCLLRNLKNNGWMSTEQSFTNASKITTYNFLKQTCYTTRLLMITWPALCPAESTSWNKTPKSQLPVNRISSPIFFLRHIYWHHWKQ